MASADAIAEALGYTRKELFAVQNDPTPLAKKTILEHHRLISTILSQADKEQVMHGKNACGGWREALCPCVETGLRKYIGKRCLNEIGQARQSFDACRVVSLY